MTDEGAIYAMGRDDEKGNLISNQEKDSSTTSEGKRVYNMTPEQHVDEVTNGLEKEDVMIVDTTTVMQEETSTASSCDQERIDSNEGGGGGGSMKPVNPKETKNDMITTIVAATSAKQHDEGSNDIGDGYSQCNTTTQRPTVDHVQPLCEKLRSLTPTISQTAEKPKMTSLPPCTIELQQGGDDGGNHVPPPPLGPPQQQHSGRSTMATTVFQFDPVSREDALIDLSSVILAANERRRLEMKPTHAVNAAPQKGLEKGSLLSSSNHVTPFITREEEMDDNSTSEKATTSFSKKKRKQGNAPITRSNNSAPLLVRGDKMEALSTMALKTSMTVDTISKKWQILGSMIRSLDCRYYGNELNSALSKSNNAGASEVLANLRMGVALLDVCHILKNRQKTIEREKQICAALDKKAIDLGLTLPFSSEEEEQKEQDEVPTTTPSNNDKRCCVIDVLDQLYSRLLASKAMNKSIEGCKLEDRAHSQLFETLKNFQKTGASKMNSDDFEVGAESNEPEGRTWREVSAQRGAEDASENSRNGNMLLGGGVTKYARGSTRSSEREEENESLIVPHVWKYYPLTYPPCNVPLLLTPLSRRPDYVAAFPFSDDNECEEVENDDSEVTISYSSGNSSPNNHNSRAINGCSEKGEKKSLGGVLDELSISCERHQCAKAFACQLRSAIHATVNGRHTLMSVRDRVLDSLTSMDNEIEKMEVELEELQSKKLGRDRSNPAQDDENLDKSHLLGEEDDDDKEECVVISTSDGNVVEIFERSSDEIAGGQQQQPYSSLTDDDESDDDETILLSGVLKRMQQQRVVVNKRSKISDVEEVKSCHLEKDLAIDTSTKRVTRSTKTSTRQMLLSKRKRY